VARQFRNTEIQNLYTPIAGNENILGFQITMDDSLCVRRRQSFYDLLCAVQRFPDRHCSAAQLLAKGLAFQVFQDEEIGIVVFAYIVKNADVGMLERRDALGLALEPRANAGVQGKMRR
jgi:hypothetical protein